MTKLYVVYNNTDIIYPDYGVYRNYYYTIHLTREKADQVCKENTNKNETETNIVKEQILERNLDYNIDTISESESCVLEITEGEAFGDEVYDEELKEENSMILDKDNNYIMQKPAKFYIVYKIHDCYNIYFTRERAVVACKNLIDKAFNKPLKNLYDRDLTKENLKKNYLVFEVLEGNIFGDDESIEALRQK